MPDIFDQLHQESAPEQGDIFDQIHAAENTQPSELARRLSPAASPQPPAEPPIEQPRAFVGPRQPIPGAEATGTPGVPIMGANVQPVPLFNEPQNGPPSINEKTGLPRQEPGYGAVPILDAPIRGTQRIIQGSIGLRDAFHQATASDIENTNDAKKSDAMREAARRQAAGGLSNVLSGALELYTPALVAHLATAPVQTGLHVAAGMAGQQVTEKGLQAAGVPKEYAALAGDLVLLTGVYGGVQKAKAKIDATLGEHNRVATSLLEKERSGGQVAELTDAIFRGESYPVKIGEQKVTVEYAGASRTSGRGHWRVVDESGKPLHAGTGDDVQGWLRTQGAESTAPEAKAPTEPTTRPAANEAQARVLEQAKPEPGGTAPAEPRPTKSANEQAIHETLAEAKERLSDIRAMQEHLDSGQDVQMGQLTMEHTSPEERRAMLADNVQEHQKLYDELWEQLGKDIGVEQAARLKASTEGAQDVGEPEPPGAQQVGEPRPIPAAQTATPETTGVPFEAPQIRMPQGPAALPIQQQAGESGVELPKPARRGPINPVEVIPPDEEAQGGVEGTEEHVDPDTGQIVLTGTLPARLRTVDISPANPELQGWKIEGPAAQKNGHAPIASEPEAFASRTPKGPNSAAIEAGPAEEPKHDYSSTQTNLPEHVAEPMRQFARSIPDDKLGEDGRETEPHITVKYGLHDEEPAAVQKLLANEPPITATMGKASLFSNDDADVLKVDIDSPDLHRLNAKIAALPHTDTHPDYTPHATIAYLKPGEGKKYDGKEIPGVTGQKVTLDSVTFSGKTGQKVDIPLTGSNDTGKIQTGLKQPGATKPKSAAKKLEEGIRRYVEEQNKPAPPVDEIERIMEEEQIHGAPESQARSSESGRPEPLESAPSELGGEAGSERGTVPDAEAEGRPDAGSVRRPGAERNRPEQGEGTHQGNRVPSRRKQRNAVSTSHDYRITDADQIGKGGEKEKARNNLEAIRVVKATEAETRPATPEEQAKLVKYVGWGSLSGVFDAWKKEWDGLREELGGLLSPEEFAAARASTKNAHYTSPEVVAGMWRAIDHLGLRDGEASILEPSAGIGNFLGMIPEHLRDSKRTAVELDPITGRIAKLLYPSANVQITGFEKAHLADNYFDLAISNVPFGKYGVHDAKYKRTPIVTRSIHNYFFAKALDKVRPGGIVAFITSSFTMDEKSSAMRDYLSGRADFLGAVRLPGGKKGAFAQNAGTEVTTDIIFLQKRGPQTPAAGEKWADLAEVDGEDESGKPAKIPVNEYYAQHPEMMLGSMALKGTMYGPDKSKVLLGELTPEKMDAAIAKLPKDAYQPYHDESPAFESNPIHELPNPGEIKDGAYALKDGRVIIRKGQAYSAADVTADQGKRITDLIDLRDKVREVFRTQLQGDDEGEISSARAELNRVYDKLVKKYGPVTSKENIKAYDGDPDAPLVLSLEDYDRETNTAKKRDIFTKRTIERYTPPAHAEKASEALAISLAETGRLDWMRMQDLTGKTPEAVREELGDLIFQNPEGRAWETADEYLSGDVRAKLAIAENANNPDYERNVQALKAVQPKDLTPQQINARLGTSWIPAGDVKDFVAHLLLGDVESDWRKQDLQGQIHVGFAGPLGTWSVRLDDDARKLAANTDKWGHGGFEAYELIEKALNLQYPKVFMEVPTVTADGKEGSKRVINKKATLAAQEKQDKIKAEFKKWVWDDAERATRLSGKYNDEFNNLRLREYDGKHLTFPGMAKLGLRGQDLDPHQKAAVWRMIQNGNTLLAHVVGAGKTFEMIAGGMEMKRMGLIKKPMYVVPNHLVEQWGTDFLRLYPGANIFVAGKEYFSTGNRQEAMSRIATGNYDAVIVAHRSFEFLPVSDETFGAFMQEQLHEINAALAEAEAAAAADTAHTSGRRKKPRKSPTVKQLESAKARIEKQIADRSNREDKDSTIHFEDLGVDQIFVDEAHMFKNLYYATKMDRVAGLPNSNSNRAMDMFIKTQYLTRLQNGKRGVVFATGTPISNTMAEMFTMQRYLQMDHLKATGLQSFDSWAQNFGEAETGLELAPEGTGYRMNTRFSKFINLPELLTAFRSVADVKNAEDLNLPRPKLKTGKPIIISVEGSPELRAFVKELGERAEAIRSGKVKPDEDNMLAIVGEGRKAALDMRLMERSLPDNPSSKVNVAVKKIAEIWKDTKDTRSTQLVFLDMGTPRAKKDNAKPEDEGGTDNQFASVYQDMKAKLIKQGVPVKEIRFIHDAKDDEAKQRLFDDVNAGRVRILLGSTEKMGAGTNVQRKLIALHHIDVPWRPSDVEQRDGRGLRQGNENKELSIIRYVTEDSFDGYMWQTILSKAKTISQAMSGDLSVREVEDVGLMQMSAAECMAASSGNPEVRERIGVEMEVRKLSALEEAHEDAKRKARWEVQQLPTRIKRDKATRAEYEQTKKQRDEFTGESWGVEDVDLTKAGDRNKKLLQLAQTMIGEKGNLAIGTYKGFPIVAVGHGIHERKYKENGVEQIEHSQNAPTIEVGGYDARHWVAKEGEGANAGLSLANDIRSTIDTDPDRQIKELTQSVDQNEARYRDLQSELNAPFEHVEKLKKLTARLEELNQKLNIGHSENAGLADDEADGVAEPAESKITSGLKNFLKDEEGSFPSKRAFRQLQNWESLTPTSGSEGRGVWVSPAGEVMDLESEDSIKTHGTMAIARTGKANAKEATEDMLGQGYIRVRGNSIEMRKGRPAALVSAVKEARQHAQDDGQDFLRVSNGKQEAQVPLNQTGRFISNPAAFLERANQRGAAPAKMLTAPTAGLVDALKQGADDILKLIAPAAREGAESAAMSVRHRAAELARESARAEAALEAASKLLLKLPEAERWAFYDRVETGQSEPDETLDIIGKIMRALLDKSRADVQALGNGKLESFIENYLPHYYKDPKKAQKVFSDYFAKRPLEGSKGFLKRRKYETLADGMAAGLEPISPDPVELVLFKVREMQKYVMAHRVLNDLKAEGIVKFVKASNRMPEGFSRIDDKIATVFGPPFVDIKIPGPPLSRHTGRPEGRTESGPVQAGPLPYVETTQTKRVPIFGTRIMGYYAAPEPAARLVNNYLSPGLREKSALFRGFLAMGNAMNQFQLGYSAFHLGFTSMDAATSGLALGIYQTAHGNPITGLLNALKSPIELAGVPIGLVAKGAGKLGLKGAEKLASPFSTMLRGDRMLKEYYRPGSQGGDLADVVDAMLLAGGRARMDRFYTNETSKKMMEAFRAIRSTPGIGKAGKVYSTVWRVPFAITEQLSRPIMEYIVPRQKMGVFADLARYEMKRLKDASPEELQAALARAWDSVDNRMGQLVYDNLFWHKIFKDALMASVRSVGWNTGTIRELLGGAADIRKLAGTKKGANGLEWDPDVTTRLSYIIALPFMAAFVGAILQYLYTGEYPRDYKDYFFPRTGRRDKNGQPERVSSPSYIKDVVHYVLEPVRTAQNKIHPLLTTIWEMLANKDYRNKPIRNADDPIPQQFLEEAEFAIKAYTPMAVKGSQQEKERGASLGQQVPPFFGISPAPAVINRQPKPPKPQRMSRPITMKSLVPKR